MPSWFVALLFVFLDSGVVAASLASRAVDRIFACLQENVCLLFGVLGGREPLASPDINTGCASIHGILATIRYVSS